ncbi:hypothetical protein T4E_4522 [Trichinella pseudospiralis]|uniref:Uncharacterized protein n=1 Tax=Trichinella pseudospiralis TaxID=6337 RepID=A0A0V0XV59_TRIPS|nr:hypothetical protein T4E_4522 [Trichinella pseudospiralis]
MAEYIHTDCVATYMTNVENTFALTQRFCQSCDSVQFAIPENGCEHRCNGVIWNAVTIGFEVSTVTTTMKSTSHERLFAYQGRASTGEFFPIWLTKPEIMLMSWKPNSVVNILATENFPGGYCYLIISQSWLRSV